MRFKVCLFSCTDLTPDNQHVPVLPSCSVSLSVHHMYAVREQDGLADETLLSHHPSQHDWTLFLFAGRKRLKSSDMGSVLQRSLYLLCYRRRLASLGRLFLLSFAAHLLLLAVYTDCRPSSKKCPSHAVVLFGWCTGWVPCHVIDPS